jgi:hypothetical protein
MVKIAVSGTHRTGKTTLIDELADYLSSFQVLDEPYHQLEEDGHAFAELPTFDDFEAMLACSIESIVESTGDCLFDRCPCDILAYLFSIEESERFDLNQWMPRVQDAIQQIDLIVFVPVEEPDRIAAGESDHELLRLRVDEVLRDIVIGDQWALGIPAIEVTGSPGERARQVLDQLGFDVGAQ